MFAAGQKDSHACSCWTFFDKILNKVLIQQTFKTSIVYHNNVIYVTFDGDKQQNVKPIQYCHPAINCSQNSCKFYE